MRRVAIMVVALVSAATVTYLVMSDDATSAARRDSAPLVTSVLTPTLPEVSLAQLRDAAGILARRVAAFDKAGTARVIVVGRHLEVRAVAAVVTTLPYLVTSGRLEFRRVIEVEAPVGPGRSPTAAAGGLGLGGQPYTPAAFAALDCADLTVDGSNRGEAESEIVACRPGGEKFHLAGAKVTGEDVGTAAVIVDEQTGTQLLITMKFKGDGQQRWTRLTEEALGQRSPTDQVAILFDGVVISAPAIMGVITGDAQIAGDFTELEGRAIAAALQSGALPIGFTVSSQPS